MRFSNFKGYRSVTRVTEGAGLITGAIKAFKSITQAPRRI